MRDAALVVAVLARAGDLVEAEPDEAERRLAGIDPLGGGQAEGARDPLADHRGVVQDDLAGERPVGRPDKLLGADRVKWVAPLRAGEARAVQGIERLGRRAAVQAEGAEGAERVEIDRDGHRYASAVRAPLAPDGGRGRVYCAVAARSREAPGGIRQRGGIGRRRATASAPRYFVVQAVGLQGSIVPFFRPANAAFSAVVSSAGGVTLRIGASGMARFQAPLR